MLKYFWVSFFLILLSCSNGKDLSEVNTSLDTLDSIDSVKIDHGLDMFKDFCEKKSIDTLVFSEWSSSKNMNQQIAVSYSIEDAKNKLFMSVSSFIDSLIVIHFDEHPFDYSGIIDSISLNRIYRYNISCERLEQDTSGVYFYCVLIEVSHCDLIHDIGEKFSNIDSNYNHSEFTKLYYRSL